MRDPSFKKVMVSAGWSGTLGGSASHVSRWPISPIIAGTDEPRLMGLELLLRFASIIVLRHCRSLGPVVFLADRTSTRCGPTVSADRLAPTPMCGCADKCRTWDAEGSPLTDREPARTRTTICRGMDRLANLARKADCLGSSYANRRLAFLVRGKEGRCCQEWSLSPLQPPRIRRAKGCARQTQTSAQRPAAGQITAQRAMPRLRCAKLGRMHHGGGFGFRSRGGLDRERRSARRRG
jgi:hypothetical protein